MFGALWDAGTGVFGVQHPHLDAWNEHPRTMFRPSGFKQWDNRHVKWMTETQALDRSSELTKLLVSNVPWELKRQQTTSDFRKGSCEFCRVVGIPWCVCIPTVHGDLWNWGVQFMVFEIHWLYVLRQVASPLSLGLPGKIHCKTKTINVILQPECALNSTEDNCTSKGKCYKG